MPQFYLIKSSKSYKKNLNNVFECFNFNSTSCLRTYQINAYVGYRSTRWNSYECRVIGLVTLVYLSRLHHPYDQLVFFVLTLYLSFSVLLCADRFDRLGLAHIMCVVNHTPIDVLNTYTLRVTETTTTNTACTIVLVERSPHI